MAEKPPVKKVVKKKVKPFPIEATVEVNGIKKPLEIINLVEAGVVVKITTGMIFVGQYFQLHFILPVMKKGITAQVRVIRTFDQTFNIKGKKVERMAELLFTKLADDQHANIVAFLNAIRAP